MVVVVVAVCAVMAGASLFAAITDWLHNLDKQAQDQLGFRIGGGRQVLLLSALDTTTGIVLAQVTVDAESNEITSITVATPGGITFPHAQQAVRITRTRLVADKTSRETAYLTVSLPARQALPRDLQTWIRRQAHRKQDPSRARRDVP
ncbi:hypothetical protein [Micromonospora sp. KC606]|uniref:hypothetical protein n=1 Tax=Micromonospora sp. KC606 TaxID=2530379 RepID=UPI001404E671|nr:hypothetical protein [Micromonospora sp. KC606]